MKQRRRKLLGKLILDERLERDIARSGLLDVTFAPTRADATLVSDDGQRTVAWLSPSGEIAALLVQDYVVGESRRIPFAFGEIELVAEEGELALFLLTAL